MCEWQDKSISAEKHSTRNQWHRDTAAKSSINAAGIPRKYLAAAPTSKKQPPAKKKDSKEGEIKNLTDYVFSEKRGNVDNSHT